MFIQLHRPGQYHGSEPVPITVQTNQILHMQPDTMRRVAKDVGLQPDEPVTLLTFTADYSIHVVESVEKIKELYLSERGQGRKQ